MKRDIENYVRQCESCQKNKIYKSKDCDYVRLHLATVDEIMSCSYRADIILFGDFNQPHVEWSAASGGFLFADPLLSYLTRACRTLLDGLSFCSLRQRNGVRNFRNRILDLIYTSDSVTTISTAEEALESVVRPDPDHPDLSLIVKFPPAVAHYDDDVGLELDFRKTDFDALNRLLSQIDWSDIYSSVNVDEAVSAFTAKLHGCFSEVVPPFRPPKKPPWSNARLRNLKRHRSKMLKLYCRQKNQFSKHQFEEASRVYRCYNRLLYRRHVNRTENNLRRNPKQFWSFVNTKRKDYGLPTCMKLGDLTASTADENNATSNVPVDAVDFDVFTINADMVVTALAKLKSASIAGPDGIPSCVLKKCAGVLVEPLLAIFNLSLQSRTFPTIWKSSCMTPVYKKGDKTDITNYRGITSLSAGSKCFEVILNKAILEACKCYITPSQHGFFPKCSVESNLCEFTSFCINNMDSGAQIDTIYTDIKAAFDTVDREILDAKFRRLGFSGRLCDWLKSYLTNRKLYVKIGSAESATFSPQCLGPVLFALFFNDVSLVLPSGCVLIYADDLKIYLAVRKLDDCYYLQDMLKSFTKWCQLNHLVISITKCCFVKNKNGMKSELDYPEAVQAIDKRHYVDDMLVSVKTAMEAIKLVQDVKKIHTKAGFEMRNWISNSQTVLASVSEEKMQEKNLDDGVNNVTEKVLGVWWDTSEDCFTSKIFTRYDKKLFSGYRRPTKREVLRTLMMIFDPLGFIAHILMYLKVILQEIWRTKVEWDDPIEDAQFHKWQMWLATFPQIATIGIPRCYRSTTPVGTNTNVQMHTFVDAMLPILPEL
ncbi:uncharacterized protein LOC129728773 [Wyeomyia smithii]|uniref:uncharacterized protein LOC129728773 n=1 Tax=Wyeomyia smithii TaxID=174621 RepID=UPI002467CABF|nr:uncharacterized protein LOC129728773 [Wyeomyia smithii]